jgi:putative transposase
MPRVPRVNQGGIAYHVLNRANGRVPLFACDEDYELFLTVLAEAHGRVPMRTIGYCVMPNHWHLVLWPRGDGDLAEFMRWLGVTHTNRHHAARGTVGTGHVYQGRYKSFPIQQTRPARERRAMGMLEGGDATLSVLRYVERNPVRAGLASSADAWPWSSAATRGSAEAVVPLADPPGGPPAEDWLEWVNRPQSEHELAALRRCLQRGRPFGREDWVKRMAGEWNLGSTLRPRGRPRNRTMTSESTEKGS